MKARRPGEDWAQTLVACFMAATVALVAGWVVQQLGSRAAGPWVVFVSGPFVVFLLARSAARMTTGRPMVRATIVALGPVSFFAIMLLTARWTGYPRAARFNPLAILIWGSLNAAFGVLGGLAASRERAQTEPGGHAGREQPRT